MKTNHRSLKQKYIIFIASVVLTIVATQLIIQFDLNEQNEDAALINVAGRQRMISQRIPKTIRYIQDDIVKGEDHHRIDTLKKLIDEWARVHYELIRGNQEESNSTAIDSLLNLNTPYLETIVNAAQRVIDSPYPTVVENAVMEITKAELPYLMLMENTVLTYQREAEQKLSYLKKAELVLSLLSILFLILEFVFIFLPVLNALRVNNKKLIDLNRELGNANQELVSSEEEIRTNLDQISMLQMNLEIRERVYREMVEGVVDMIYELDPDGRFSFVNPVMLSMTGFTRDELIGRPYWELVHEADRDMVIEFYRQQRKRLEDDSYLEFRMISKSNSEVWIGQTVRMFFTNGWIYKVNVVARNITSLKQVQLKLAEREELYRLISENSNDVIVLIDQNRHFSFVSHSAKEVLGFLPEELLGKTIFDLIHDDEKEFIRKQGDEIREKHKTLPLFVFRVRHKNGNYLWVETQSRPFYDAKGDLQFVQSSFRDITKRKEAEAKLAESEKLYKLLSENMQDLVTLFTPDGKYTFLSPSVKDMLGYLPEELIGTFTMDLVHPDDLDFLMSVQRVRALSGQKFINPPFRLRRKDAHYIWVETFTTPVMNEKGEIVFIQTTSRNITERKAFEQALLEAKDKAEKATRAKSQFLSMMSHEIRTPMNAIIGLTNLMLEAKPRIDQIESLNLLKFSGENLLTIINDILDFSKIEADKIQIEKIDFDINELLRSMVKMMEHRAKDKQVSIVFHPDEKLQFVKGDPVRIGQVITNLIGNGMKFTEKGEVKLSVQKINQQGPCMTIQFEVKDTGIGIPEDRIDTIFESFSQAEGSITRKFGGTGLGLTITRKLINLMGSEIYVESKLGQGSRFYFNLILEQGEKPKEQAKEFSDLPALLKHKRVNVLLAEDNKVNQVVAVNFLKKWGVHVTIANNGKEAVELIKDKSIDIVLMDLQMPEMDGYEATAAIRSMDDSYFKNVPIIALTAEAMIEMREKVLAAGMNDFMSKPFRPEDLQRVIGKHVLKEEEIDFNNSSSHLSGQLDIYTEGNIDFKYELVTYFIRNLQEMKSELERSFDAEDFTIFRTIAHKCKPTLRILGYNELMEIVNEVDATVEKVGADRKKFPKDLHHRFYQMCGQIINDLQEEAENIKKLR